MKDFQMSGTNMNRLLKDLETIRHDLNDSYELLTLFLTRVDTEKAWLGKAKNTFSAYMGLMQQYHACFTDYDKENPIQMAIDALTELEKNVDTFYENYLEYSNMEGIE